jgi:hypothetical protein
MGIVSTCFPLKHCGIYRLPRRELKTVGGRGLDFMTGCR